jgi:hypothetical protein
MCWLLKKYFSIYLNDPALPAQQQSYVSHLVTTELGSAGPPRHPEVSAAGLVVGGRGAAAAATSGLEGGAGGSSNRLAGSVEEVSATGEPELEPILRISFFP